MKPSVKTVCPKRTVKIKLDERSARMLASIVGNLWSSPDEMTKLYWALVDADIRSTSKGENCFVDANTGEPVRVEYREKA